MTESFDLMEVRKLADDVARLGQKHLRGSDLKKLAQGFVLCDRLRAEAEEKVQNIEMWFRQGSIAAECAASSVSPYEQDSLANHWWTRGYSHVIRLMRAHISEAALKEK